MREEREHVRQAIQEIMAVVRSLGANSGKYRGERQRAIKAVTSDIYSPPRVTQAITLLPELKLIPGFALDLTTTDSDGRRWDFDEKAMRERAMKRATDEKPLSLIGSPMCTAFSSWQRINTTLGDKYAVEAKKKRAVMHLEFCVELYREQLKHGRYFLHEHPAHASSWQQEAVAELMGEHGVVSVVGDQCQYGSATEDG